MEKKLEKNKKKYKVKYSKVKAFNKLTDEAWNKLEESKKKEYIDKYNKAHNIKTHYLSFRISDKEYDFINDIVKDKKVKRSDILYYFLHEITQNDKDFLRAEIKKIGININQMARKCNTENDKPELKELAEINKNLEKIINAF